jgi:hypothetical protein
MLLPLRHSEMQCSHRAYEMDQCPLMGWSVYHHLAILLPRSRSMKERRCPAAGEANAITAALGVGLRLSQS